MVVRRRIATEKVAAVQSLPALLIPQLTHIRYGAAKASSHDLQGDHPVVSSDQRRRQLAREKFERQQQRREEARRRTRRLTVVIASSVAVVAVIGVGAYLARGGDDTKNSADAAASASPSASPSESESSAPEPAMKIDKKAEYTMSLKTSQGDIGIAMDASKTPHTTNSFKALADKGYFDDTKCHRLTTEG